MHPGCRRFTEHPCVPILDPLSGNCRGIVGELSGNCRGVVGELSASDHRILRKLSRFVGREFEMKKHPSAL